MSLKNFFPAAHEAAAGKVIGCESGRELSLFNAIHKILMYLGWFNLFLNYCVKVH
jgi:hypothetical protein